jgi:hypothetical protein
VEEAGFTYEGTQTSCRSRLPGFASGWFFSAEAGELTFSRLDSPLAAMSPV